MRIAQMISGTAVDGPSRCCAMLSHQLAARGHAVTLFHRPQAWIAGNVDRARIGLVEFGRGLAELRRIRRILRDGGIDVLHTHMTGASNFGVLSRLAGGVPVVATLHSGRVRAHWRFNSRVIALSRSTFDAASRICGPERVALIPNFIETGDFRRFDGAVRADLRRSLGIPDSAFVVGCVGKVTPDKGQRALVSAVAKAVRAGIDCRLVLVGPIYRDEGRRVTVHARSEGLDGRVILAGLRHDVSAILHAFDVFASSSQQEEMSIAVMEAMAVGLPVVATAVGGTPLLVADGRNGFLTEVGAVDVIADRLGRLAGSADLRQAFGAASQARIATEFSPEAIVPRIERVLADAAAERSRPLGPVAARRSS